MIQKKEMREQFPKTQSVPYLHQVLYKPSNTWVKLYSSAKIIIIFFKLFTILLVQ